ncbi:MAG: hypothetical protein GY933_16500 [Hyphomicrobiales bacterium]|nr:hypothetical protein [Hyphomicrobiales bacterium]
MQRDWLRQTAVKEQELCVEAAVRNWWTCVVAVSLIGPLFVITAEADSTPICVDINKILETRGQLRPFMGPSIWRGVWSTSLAVSGFSSCKIGSPDDRVLAVVCATNEKPTRDAGKAVFRSLADALKLCFPDWQHQQLDDGDLVFELFANESEKRVMAIDFSSSTRSIWNGKTFEQEEFWRSEVTMMSE